MQTTLTPQFSFAGFSFPRYIANLPSKPIRKRLEDFRKPKHTSGYYHAPKPLQGAHPGQGFYLEDAQTMPGMRWKWADEVEDTSIHHTGWYCDAYGDTLIRGLVMRLPAGRGFLAGYSMGEGMSSAVEGTVYADEREAALAADRLAEIVAERERDHEAEEQAYQEAEEAARAELEDASEEHY